eukprot:scaffold1522_cov166-Amphora_coffeaeformis.AAC.4
MLGGLDQLFRLLKTLPGSSKRKFFTKGHGDVDLCYKYREAFLTSITTPSTSSSSSSNGIDRKKLTEIEWADEKTGTASDEDVMVTEGRFKSPVAEYLPTNSKTAIIHYITPRRRRLSNDADVVVIMLPATGEMGKSTRLALARTLAKEYGWSSVILTAAYYGKRRPSGQHMFFLDTVQDLLFQSQAIIEEAALLAQYFMTRTTTTTTTTTTATAVVDDGTTSNTTKVCFTGFSYGAAMASCAAGVALFMGLDCRRMSCAPYIGSASPVVLADGILQSSIDYGTLQRDRNTKNNIDRTTKTAEQELYDELNKTQLTSITKFLNGGGGARQPEQCLSVVMAYAARNDAFILPVYSRAFEVQLGALTEISNPPKLKWLWGGHVTAALVRSVFQKQLVVDTVLAMMA